MYLGPNGEIVLETMTAEEWVKCGEALAPEKVERFFKESKMGVKKNKGNRLSAAEIEDQEFLNGESAAPVAVLVKKETVPTPVHNLRDKKVQSNLRRLKAVFHGYHKKGQKMPDGWKGDGYSAPLVKKSKHEEVAEKPAVAKAVKKMKSRQKV